MFTITAGSNNRKVLLQIKGNQKATVRGIRQAFYFLGRDLKDTANKNILATPRFGKEEKFRGRNEDTISADTLFPE